MDDNDSTLRQLARTKRKAVDAVEHYEQALVAAYNDGATLSQLAPIDGYGTDEGMAKRLRRLGATIRARGRQKA